MSIIYLYHISKCARLACILYLIYSYSDISFHMPLIHLNNIKTTTTSCVLLSTVCFIHSCFETFFSLHQVIDKKERSGFPKTPFFFHLYHVSTFRFMLHFIHNIFLCFSAEHTNYIMFFIISLPFIL